MALGSRGDPFNEADGRRLTGLHFPIEYKNNPQGPNEEQKDATLKHRVHEMIPEFWFIAGLLVMHATLSKGRPNIAEVPVHASPRDGDDG